MECEVCNCKRYNYKCPNCRILYCSLNCWKEHKKMKCEAFTPPESTEQENTTRKLYNHETEDTVLPDRLLLLDQSETLREILQNPELRELLKSVDKSPNPERAMQDAMKNPMFVQFSDVCLRVVQPPDDVAIKQAVQEVPSYLP